MIFKIHYGLWYGGLVGIIPFMFNYAAEYSNATGTQHGILYTVLPFLALIAKPVIGSIADKYAAHHHCLLFFIFTTLLGYGSLAIYPFFPDLIQNHKDLVWILYCLAALVGNTSMCVVNSIGDSLAMNSVQKKGTSYGEYRFWGPVGFGIFGAIWGIANEIPSMPKYTPGIITMALLLCVNSLLIAFWYDRDEFRVLHISEPHNTIDYGSTRDEEGGDVMVEVPKVHRVSLLWKLARQHNSIFAYVFIFTFCGMMTAIHWQFFFKYLEQVSKGNFSLIATLAIPVQALGGELVFFKLSGVILEKLGSFLTLVICLFSFSARYLLYAYLIPYVNIYWILLVELLQGPAFGLMYSVLAHQANYYSQQIDELDMSNKNSLHATLQGMMGATFEGLGLGLGAIVGGLAYDISPILMWQIAGFSALVVTICCCIVAFINRLMIGGEAITAADDNADDDNNGGISDPEETAVQELRRIAKRCHSENKPQMSEIRSNLEELSQKLNSSPASRT